MNVQEILNGRTEFEDITECYNMNGHAGSSINSLKWFVENGHKSNSLRNGFNDAMEIAEEILMEVSTWQKQKHLNPDLSLKS